MERVLYKMGKLSSSTSQRLAVTVHVHADWAPCVSHPEPDPLDGHGS